jgi:hypothetical protein
MLQHLDKQRGTGIKNLLLANDANETTVKKVLSYTSAEGEKQLWPNAPTHLRIESNYDDSTAVRIENGKIYGHPVIDPGSDLYKPLEITVTPFPINSAWTLEAENFDLGQHAGKMFHGKQTVTFDVSVPSVVGHFLHRISAVPNAGEAERAVFSFWSVKFSESALIPKHWWSFDDETLADQVGNMPLVKETTEGTTTYTDGVRRKALQAIYVNGATEPNTYRATVNPSMANGLSLSMFGQINRGGSFGFVDLNDYNATNGNHFAFNWYYRQPINLLLDGYGTTTPESTAYDRLEQGEWHHLALTMSPQIDLANHPDIEVDYSENQYGTIRYASPHVDYSTEWVCDYYNNYLTQEFYLAKFYIDGVLHSEKLMSFWPGGFNTPGNGVITLDFNNSNEQDGYYPDRVDELKVFEHELSLAEIRGECSLIGLQFESDNPTEGGGVTVEPIERSGRSRDGEPPDIAAVPLDCRLKAFVIDNQTIAVGGNFRDFFLERLETEFPNLDATEFNFRNGFSHRWSRDFNYLYNMWELYRDYQPLIVAAMDDASNWSVDNSPVTMLGRWQNSTGLMRFGDAYDGTDVVTTDCADIVHFAYLRLPQPMTEESSHAVDWNGNQLDFSYSRDKAASSIKVNQEGYLPEARRKYAYFGTWLGTGGAYQHSLNDLTFHLVPVGSTIPAFTGTMTRRNTAETHTQGDVTFQLTGEETYVCDFSAFQTEGDYQIHIPSVGYSHVFKVGKAALGKAFWTHCRGMFHQRSGCDSVVNPYTNWEFPGAAHYWTWESNFICDDQSYNNCATVDGTTYGEIFPQRHFSMIPNNVTGKLYRDLRGGWFDAADFDRRPYHFYCVRDLVEAYLRFPQNFTDSQLDLPESGDGIPDVLSEAEWGLDVWRRAQKTNGGVACWIEADGHESGWPWESDRKYYIGMPNRKDSLEYAQCAAKFARALRLAGTPSALAKADVYTESAVRAFNFGINPVNAATLEFTQTNSSNSQFDFSYTEAAERADWHIVPAAAALLALTREPRFAKHVTESAWDNYFSSLQGDENNFAQRCCTELLFDLTANFPDYSKALREFIIAKADQWQGYQEQQPYFEMNWPPNHQFYQYVSWGVGHPEKRGKAFIYAWLVTGDDSYRDSALLAMDNFAGCNPMGRSLTTGLGKVSPIHFLNSWLPRAEIELGLHEPVPGITPYTYIGDGAGKSTSHGFCLWKGARTDFGFDEMTQNILPGGYSQTVAPSRGNVAQWLQINWPLWRHVFELEAYNVAQSEFTVSETVSGKAFMAGCLMGSGVTPDPAWKTASPATERYEPEGLVYLP